MNHDAESEEETQSNVSEFSQKNMFEDGEVSQSASLKRLTEKKKCRLISTTVSVNMVLQVRNRAELTGRRLS